MYFYVVFAILLLLPARWLGVSLLGWAGLVLIGYFFGISQAITTDIPSLATSLLTLEFILGAGAGLLITHKFDRFAGWLSILGAAGFMLALLLYRFETNEALAWQRVILFAFPVFLLILGTTTLEQRGRFTAPRWLVILGDWSFSLYLTHFLVVSFLKQAYTRLELSHSPFLPAFMFIEPGNLVGRIIFAGLAIGLSLAIAGLSYKWLEQPSLRLSRKLSPF